MVYDYNLTHLVHTVISAFCIMTLMVSVTGGMKMFVSVCVCYPSFTSAARFEAANSFISFCPLLKAPSLEKYE